MIKDETWYVSSGELILKWIDTSSAIQNEKKIKKGDIIRIMPGLPHQLMACVDSEIFEISTTHYDNDSYRVFKGDSQL
jgi:mannose-6-phosphate isomerase-like protein (cupin superfamily)